MGVCSGVSSFRTELLVALTLLWFMHPWAGNGACPPGWAAARGEPSSLVVCVVTPLFC